MAAKVAKLLLKEIISRFGLPRSLQTDNASIFMSQVTKGITSTLGIKWTLLSAWKPQSSTGEIGEIQSDLEMGLSQAISENSRKLDYIAFDCPFLHGVSHKG